ncbi:MAG: mechanosensitive ion channel family protein [Candidatus Spechtbacterales bacterium]
MQNLNKAIIDFILPWLLEHGIRIAIIVVGLWIAHKFAEAILSKTIRKMVKTDRFASEEEEIKREDTIINIMVISIHVAIWVLGGLMILSEIGINITPLIAAAGIGGLAFGFGGQYLISDLISGLFIILENQYRIGDVVCFDKTCGLVEKITLRRTILRDLDGTVHNVPNGQIKTASNLSHEYARVNLNIGVDYSTNLEKVIKVINRVGNELTEDKNWKEDIIKTPQFLRVDEFADSAIVIKILGETKPLRQWDVTGELRKRLKIAFDNEGIVIPFNQLVLHKAPENG